MRMRDSALSRRLPISVDPVTGICPHHVRRVAKALGLDPDLQKQMSPLLTGLYKAFTEKDTSASLEDIARRADVGIGTLYRHFPDRESLVNALMERWAARIHGVAEDAENFFQKHLPKSVPPYVHGIEVRFPSGRPGTLLDPATRAAIIERLIDVPT